MSHTFLCLFMLAFCMMTARAVTAHDPIDDYIRDTMQREHIPGLALAVVKDGRVIRKRGYGLANLELNVHVMPQTVFQIQSITKQFTATAIMMLVEEGKIELDKPVSAYLEGCPETWSKITIRRLLNQTSGLKDFINYPVQSLRLDVTEEEVFTATVVRPLNFPVGQRYQYSNTNYHLLGMIIRKLTGMPYGDFLQKRIFEPLGMDDTRIISLTDVIPNRASGYLWEGNKWINGQYIAQTVLGYAGGGIRSTILDMVKWDIALTTNKLLKASSLKQMWSPGKLNDGTNTSYGFGWVLGKTNGHRFIEHAGGHLTGFNTDILRFPDDRISVIVLTNQSGASDASKITHKVAGLVLKDLANP